MGVLNVPTSHSLSWSAVEEHTINEPAGPSMWKTPRDSAGGPST
jgi:hypothetical protein